ncbi:hypothetical protein KUV65_17180 [Maritalea mobilis]|uniref:hypothetical protein n=1 Tax=Maritalea mobilis TaxID=483324 RepID=UPI001C93E981|nr:hypothetical protein [Maritalea mobilis]MBY6203107.1 hypothetical protein [Maritalea mobilis]
MHKTGTSAIQAHLRANAPELLRQGVLYPTTGQAHDGAHHGLWQALHDHDETAQFIAALEEEISAQGDSVTSILLSSELLEKLAQDPRRAANLATFLELFGRIDVLYFVRNQAKVIQSIYKQWVKDDAVRLSAGPNEFLQQHGGQLFYSKYADWWDAFDDRIALKVGLYDGNWDTLWDQFRNFSGVVLDGCGNSRLYNPSLDGECLKIKHWLNANVPIEAIDFPVNRWLLQNFSSKPKTTLFEDEIALNAFQAHYQAENESFQSRWQIDGLDKAGNKGPYFRTASPALISRFRQAVLQDPTTKDSRVINHLD